ncbi:MAG: tetratricopeptide repeat protein [Candidatus Poribacteria bacterium]|nr:tetratricopeptide repeat protein [Candidatus Poribacteria bacterium]
MTHNEDTFNRLYGHYFSGEDIERMITDFRSEAESNPNHSDLQLILGHINKRLGKDNEAIDAYKLAAKLAPDDYYPRYVLGKMYTKLHRHEEAVTALTQAADLESEMNAPLGDMIAIYKTLGDAFFAQDRVEEGVSAWTKISEIAPHNISARIEVAESFREKELYSHAIEQHEEVIRLKKNDPHRLCLSYREIGRIQEEKGENQSAILSYDAAMPSAEPGSWLRKDLQRRIAMVFAGDEDYESLIRHYKKLLKETPDDLELIGSLAAAYVETSRLDEGIAAYRQALQHSPTDAVLRLKLISVLLSAQELDVAAIEYEYLCEHQPDNLGILRELGELYLELQDENRAKMTFRRMIDRNPESASTHLTLAEIYAGHGWLNEAVAAYEKAVSLSPDNLDYIRYYGEFYLRGGNPDKALETWNRMVMGSRSVPENNDRLARLLERKGLLTGAIVASRTAVALAPGNYGYRCALARRLMENEEYDAALSEYKEAVKLAPSEFTAGQANDRMIEIYRRQGTLAEQIEKSEAAPKAFNQQMQLANMHLEMGNVTNTFEVLLQARELQSDNVPVNRRLASIYAKQKLWDDALETYGRLIKIDSANARQYYVYIAHIQEQKRNFSAAIQAAKQAIAFNPRNPEGYRLLAGIDRRRRDYMSAIDNLERSVRLSPNTVEIRSELAHVYDIAGKYRQALEQYWQCWVLTDNLTDKLSIVEPMAKIYENLAAHDEFGESLRQMQKWNPDDLAPSMALAKLHQLRGYLIDANEELEQLLASGVENPDLLGQLVEINYELNNMPAAIAYQRWIVEIHTQPVHQLRLTELFFESGQEQNARQIWVGLMRDRNQTVEVDIELAFLLIRHGLRDEALFFLNRAGENVQAVERRYQIGALLAQMEDFEGATRQFERILTMTEPYQSVVDNTALTGDNSILQYPTWLKEDAWRFRRPTQLIHDIQRMDGNANNPPPLPNSFAAAQDGALAHLVLIAKKTDRLSDFLAHLEAEVESDPTNLKELETLTKVYVLLEFRREAARTMAQLIALSPNDYVYRAAQIYYALPPNLDYQTARSFVQGFTRCSVETRLWYVDRLAQHLQHTENRDSAKKLVLEVGFPIERLNKLVSEESELSHAVTILMRLGETTAVESLLSQLASDLCRPATETEKARRKLHRQHTTSLLLSAYLNIGQMDLAVRYFWQWLEQARPNVGSVHVTPLILRGDQRHSKLSSVTPPNNYIHGNERHLLQKFFMYYWARNQLQPFYAKLHAMFNRAEGEAKIYPGMALCYVYTWDELPEKTLEILSELKTTFPDDLTFLLQTAIVSIETGKHRLAISALSKLAEKNGRYRQNHNHTILQLAIRTGNTVKVRELLSKMLDEPVEIELLVGIARELQDHELTQYALATAKRAMKLARKRHDPNLLKKVSAQLDWLGSGKDAAVAAEQARRILNQRLRYGRLMYHRKFGHRTSTTPLRPNANRESKLRDVVERTPSSFQAQMRLAAYYERTNQIDKAVAAFEAALSLRPQDWFTRKRYAQMLLRGGRTDAAVVQLTVLIEDNLRALGSMYYDVIRAFFDAGKVNEIVALAKKKIELSSGHDFSHTLANGVASVCLQRNQPGMAVEIYDSLFSIQPYHFWKLLSAYTAAGDFDNASRLLWNELESGDSPLMKGQQEYTQVLYKLIEIYKATKQTDALCQKFRRRLLDNPDDIVQAYVLMQLQISTGENEDVQALLNRLLEDASSWHLGWLLNLARIYREAGNRENEIRLLERAIHKLNEIPVKFPRLSELRQAFKDLGNAYAESGDKQRAREHFRKMTTVGMVDSGRVLYLETADLYFRHEMWSDAEALYTETLRDLFGSQYERKVAQERLLELRECMNTFNEVQGSAGNLDPHVLRALAHQHMKQGRLANAAEFLERLTERMPEDFESRANLAKLYSRQSDHDAALNEWYALLKSDPYTTEYQDGIVKAHQSAGQTEMAIQLAKEFIEAATIGKGMHYVRLADVYASDDRFEEAIAAYSTTLEMDPGDRSTCQALAKIYLGRNDFDAAENTLMQALRYTIRQWDRNEIEGQILALYRQQGKLREKLERLGAEGTLTIRMRQELANHYRDQREWHNAAVAYRNALDMATESQSREEIQFSLIGAYANIDEFESAFDIYQSLDRSGETRRSGSWSSRSDSFDRVIDFAGDKQRQKFIAVYRTTNKLDGLISYLEKRHESNPNNPILLETCAEIHLTRGDYTLAAEAYMRLSSVQPENVRSYYYAAASLNKANQPERAQTMLDEGEIARVHYSAGPWNQSRLGLVALASICLQGEMYDASIRLLNSAISNQRHSAQEAEEVSYHLLAEACIGANRFAEAVEAYRKLANVTRHDHMKRIAREGIRRAAVQGHLSIHRISDEFRDLE